MSPRRSTPTEPIITSITHYIWILATVWTLVIAGLLAWNLWQNRQVTRQRAITEARANFNKDQAFRFWATAHGGVYVPTDERTPPNPYLSHIPERDIETPSGKKLTLMNPAYMVRQMNEEFGELYGIVGHITSLNLLNPANAPDEWERAALLAFEQGKTEVLEFSEINGKPYVRLMQPMIAQEGCLKCHSHQGYEVGNVRGGVGIALPIASLLAGERQTNAANALTLGLLWLLGIGGLVISRHNFNQRIEERNQAVVNLQQNEIRYRQIFETNQAVKLIIEPTDGRIVEANQAAVRFYGYDYPTLTRMRIMDINTLTEAEVRQEMEQAQREERLFFNFRHRLASGEIRDVEVYSGPINTPQGELLYSIIQDVTRRYQAEEIQTTTLEQFKALIGNLQMGVLVETASRKIIHTNQAFCDLFGLPSLEAILGADCDAAAQGAALLFQNPPHFIERINNILAEGKVVVNEELQLNDGHIFERDYVPVYVRGDFIGNMWLYRDITKRKQMKQQLVQQERLAAVGQLTAGIAHDFNNILTTILGFAELLQLSPDTPETIQPELQQISTSSQRASHLVRQLLDYSRKTIRRPQQFELDTLLKESATFLVRTIPENIEIMLHIAPGDYRIEADPTQIQQVITNLAVNARDAMPTGGKLEIGLARFETTGEEKCATCNCPISGAWLGLTIADNGSGITAAVLSRIFEPFFTTKEIGKGTGLGLAQVYGIISQHAGHITVNSQAGQGTTITVYLPPAPEQNGKQAEETPPIALPGQGQTILLVADSLAVTGTIKVLLERLHYRVITAVNGREALAIYRAQQATIALVLSDMVMPDMDGEALFQALKKADPDLKMVVMSGYPLGEKGARLLRQGIVAWLEKPVSFRQLAQVVGKALSNKIGRWS